MVTCEILVAVSDDEIEQLTAKSAEQLRQVVGSKDGLRTMHWSEKLQKNHVVDDFGQQVEAREPAGEERYQRLDLDIYWDSLHWLLTGSPDADSVAPHVKLYHLAKKTSHKNLYEITQMENRVTYRYGPLSPSGTRTVTKVFTDKNLAEQDVLANLEDKFEKGYLTAFIHDPEEMAAKTQSKKRGAPSNPKGGRQKKQKVMEEEAEPAGETEPKEGSHRGAAQEPHTQESQTQEPREPPPSQVTPQETPQPESSSSSTTEQAPTPASSSISVTAAEIVAHQSPKKVEREEWEMDHLRGDMKAAFPVSASEEQAPSSVVPMVKPSSQVVSHGRMRAPVEPTDLTPAELNAELAKYNLSTEGGLKKKLARLTLQMMRLFPVEKHPHELGYLAGGGKVLTEHLFKGQLRAVSCKETKDFFQALKKVSNQTLRERFNVDQARQLVFRSVKEWREDDVEKLLHYAHSLEHFLEGLVKENKGFLVYLK